MQHRWRSRSPDAGTASVLDKKPEKKNGGKEVQHIDNIEEDIMNDFDDLDDLSANKNSGNYNSSQTISQSQGGDNTVDSHLLETYNYVEQNEKVEKK